MKRRHFSSCPAKAQVYPCKNALDLCHYWSAILQLKDLLLLPICHYATNINEPHKLFHPDSDNLRHTIRDRLVGMGAVQNWGTDSYPSASNEAIAAHSMDGRGRPCACPLPSKQRKVGAGLVPALCSSNQRKVRAGLVPALCLQSAEGRGRPCACPLLSNQRKVRAGLVPALCLQSAEGRGRPCACPLLSNQRKVRAGLVPALCLQSAAGRGRPCACPLLSNQRKVGAGLVPALCSPISGR